MRVGTVRRITIAWALVTVAGIGSFVYAKKLVDKQRYEAMKVRERMKNCNTGDYEPQRKFTF